MKKLIFSLMLLLISLMLISPIYAAVHEDNYFKYAEIDESKNVITTNTPVNDVNIIAFVCDTSDCSSVSTNLWGVLTSAGNFIELVYPTSLLNYGYAIYMYKQGYIPYEVYSDYAGEGNAPDWTNYLAKVQVCEVEITSFDADLSGDEIEVSVDVDSPIENAGPLDYVPSEIEEHYSVEVDVNLEVEKDGSDYYSETKTVDIPFSEQENVEFSFSTAGDGGYEVYVYTSTDDEKCLDYEIDEESEVITIDRPEDPVCGNNVLEQGEQCDDGNTENEDGCDEFCMIENGPEPFCGDSILDLGEGEECDDGNTENGDGCDEFCIIEGPEPPVCSDDSDCEDDYYSENYCSGDDVYRDFHDFSCEDEECVENITSELIEECDDDCDDGECDDSGCWGEYCEDRFDSSGNAYFNYFESDVIQKQDSDIIETHEPETGRSDYFWVILLLIGCVILIVLILISLAIKK